MEKTLYFINTFLETQRFSLSLFNCIIVYTKELVKSLKILFVYFNSSTCSYALKNVIVKTYLIQL